MSNKNLTCPNCGANLELKNEKYLKCKYCGTDVENPSYFGLFNFSRLQDLLKNNKEIMDNLKNSNKVEVNNTQELYNQTTFEEVSTGEFYYAVIKKSTMFYSGFCPNISFTDSGLCDSFEECVNTISKKLNEQVNTFSLRKYSQPPLEELTKSYPDSRIVKIYVTKK